MIFLKYDRRILQNFDWTLFALVMCICAIGIINIYSTGFSLSDDQSPLYIKQLQWIMFGLFLMLITFLIDYRAINQAAYIIYALSMHLWCLWPYSVTRPTAHKDGSLSDSFYFNLPN